MTFARLLAAVLLFCSLSAAQTSKWGTAAPGDLSGSHLFFWDFSDTAATPSEPWRLIRKLPTDASSQTDLLSRKVINEVSRHDSDPVRKSVWPYPFRFAERPQQDIETSCLSIRSYVVARDSKDSDSTHLVSYSTCQPTERYRLKSTEIRVESPDR